MKPKSTLRSFLLGCSSLLVASSLPAAPLYWDGTTTGADADGGDGTWIDDTGTTTNWDDAATGGVDTAWTNANNDTAVFGGATGAVTIDAGGVTVGGLQFDTAGYTLSGGVLTFGAAGSITANENATISSELAGSAAIEKSGAGSLTLSGVNTSLSSPWTLSAGTLVIDNADSLGTGTLTFDNGGTAPATTVFSFASTYSNPVTVAVGSTDVNTIQSNIGAGTVKLDGAVTINAGTTLKLDNSGDVFDMTSVITGDGGLETTGSSTGNFIIRGASTYSGNTLLGGAGAFVLTASSSGPAGSPTDGPFGTGTLTIGDVSMRSTNQAETSIGNTLVLAGNLSGGTATNEKNLIYTGPATLTGTRTINSSIGQTVAASSMVFSGIIDDGGNGYGLIVQGTGNLTLSGANTYSGDTTLDGGTLVVSNAASFGTGDVSVIGNSRINSTGGITYANDLSIASGAVLTMQNVGGNTTSTYSGPITGLGGITNVTGSGGGSQTITLSNTNNTFTGDLTLATGTGANDFINFASIGDGGSIVCGRSSWRANATYTGSADLNLASRSISLATTFGGASGYDGGGNPTHMFANNGTGVVTFAQDMVMTTTASSGIFFFGGTNTGDNTFAGAIGDSSNGTTVGIGKFDAGKWILSNNTNSFEGNVVLARGTLSVGVIDVAANAQPLGKGSLIIMGYRTADVGTLEYTGSGNAVTDKQIAVGTPANATNNNFRGGGVILNNGTGTLTFSNTTFNSTAGVPATGTGRDRTLTLGGTNTGANTIAGTIQDNNNGTVNAKVFLTKADDGIWKLSGANTYTGTTTINGGVLLLNSADAIPTGITSSSTGSPISINGGVLGLGFDDFTRLPNFNATIGAGKITFTSNGGFAAYGADRIVNFGGASGIVAFGSSATAVIGNMNGKTLILGASDATHKVTVTNTLDLGGGSRSIQVNDGAAAVDAEISGVIQPQAGATTAGLNKSGTGTLALSNNNTYTGTTNVNAGTLAVNGSLADATINIASGATVNGTGTLTFNIDGTTADQVVANGTINVAGLTVAVNATGAGLNQPSYVLVDATGGGTISGTFAGVTGASGYALDYGTPNQVKLVQTGGSAYSTWASTNATSGDPDDDFDGDGVSNAVEFVLGGLASTNDLGKLPAAAASGGNMTFTFVRDQDSVDGSTLVNIEVGTSLVTWPSSFSVGADTGSSSGGVVVTQNSPGAGLDTVVLTVTQSPDAKKFARLKAVVTP